MHVEIMRDFKEKLQNEAITIELLGTIGVGKSTFSRMLSQKLGIEHVEEKFIENPFLADFYKDHTRWSFDTQYRFLLDKVEQTIHLDPTKSWIIDPGLNMDIIYAMTHLKIGYMDPREGDLYMQTATILKEVYKIKDPDVILRLHAPINVLVERIKKRTRNRPDERGLVEPPFAYLRALDETIDEYVAGDKSGKIIYVDASRELGDEIHFEGIIEKIKRII